MKDPNPYAAPRAFAIAAPERFSPSLRVGLFAITWFAVDIGARWLVMAIEIPSYVGNRWVVDAFLLPHVLLRLLAAASRLVGGYLFLIWLWTSVRNARALRPEATANRAPWMAIVWFFVPIANLIMGPKVLADLVLASGAKFGAMWAWLSWLLFLVSIFCGLIVWYARPDTWGLRVFFEVFEDLPLGLAILALRKVVRIVGVAQGDLPAR